MKITKKRLKEIIIKWIYDNFGGQEAEEPCYNINMLCDYIIKELKAHE